MPRKKSVKPWLHKPSGYWCATIAGKRIYLDVDYKVACRKLIELRAKEQREIAGGKEWLDAPFANLANEYLSDLQKRRKPGTYRAVRYRLLRALRLLGTTLRVGEVRKIHIARIEQAMAENYSPTTVADTIAALQSVSGTLMVAPYRPAEGKTNAPASLPARIISRTRSRLTCQRRASSETVSDWSG